MRTNTKSAQFAYLKEGGYFDRGPEAIKLGKKLFRREYLARKKREYREVYSEHTIICKPEIEKLFAAAALSHGMKIPCLIRNAAIAYCNKRYLIPNNEAMYKVEQNIAYARTQIERIGRESTGLFGRTKDEKIQKLLESIEAMVEQSFKQPPDLDELVRMEITKNPAFAQRLKQMLLQ
jgi:hypothetical protein